jgi:hypothetical protein
VTTRPFAPWRGPDGARGFAACRTAAAGFRAAPPVRPWRNCCAPNSASRAWSSGLPIFIRSSSSATPRCTAGRAPIASYQRRTLGNSSRSIRCSQRTRSQGQVAMSAIE